MTKIKNSQYDKINGSEVGHGQDAFQRTMHLVMLHMRMLLKQVLQTVELIGTRNAICLNVI